VLGCENAPADRAERGAYRLSPAERGRGKALLKLAALVMFAFPGSPTVYYGDEAGMEGFEDPFNRRTYPWGREDTELLAHFRALGTFRRDSEALGSGEIDYLAAEGHILAFRRSTWYETALAAVNAGETAASLTLPWDGKTAIDVLTQRRFTAENGLLSLTLGPHEGLLLAEASE
jgi:4-alpha-glucanotransferase